MAHRSSASAVRRNLSHAVWLEMYAFGSVKRASKTGRGVSIASVTDESKRTEVGKRGKGAQAAKLGNEEQSHKRLHSLLDVLPGAQAPAERERSVQVYCHSRDQRAHARLRNFQLWEVRSGPAKRAQR